MRIPRDTVVGHVIRLHLDYQFVVELIEGEHLYGSLAFKRDAPQVYLGDFEPHKCSCKLNLVSKVKG